VIVFYARVVIAFWVFMFAQLDTCVFHRSPAPPAIVAGTVAVVAASSQSLLVVVLRL